MPAAFRRSSQGTTHQLLVNRMPRGRRARVSRQRARRQSSRHVRFCPRCLRARTFPGGVRSVTRKPLFFKRNFQMRRNPGLTTTTPGLISSISAPYRSRSSGGWFRLERRSSRLDQPRFLSRNPRSAVKGAPLARCHMRCIGSAPAKWSWGTG